MLLCALMMVRCFMVFGLQIDKRLQNLKKEVAVQDAKHRKTLGEVSYHACSFSICVVFSVVGIVLRI